MKASLQRTKYILTVLLLSSVLNFFILNNTYASVKIDEDKNNKITISHAISFHDNPKYPANFKHFEYVNPNAPKQGVLKQAKIGTFDTFNTFLHKGIFDSGCYFIYDPLMVKSGDESYTVYGLVAQKIEYPEDLSWVIYHINLAAKFQDGVQITAEDVAYTFKQLVSKCSPHYKDLYKDIEEVKVIKKNKVYFKFKTPNNRALVLQLSQLQVIPKHYWNKLENDISKPTLVPPLASGPYRIKNFEFGKYITYELIENYWAKNLPVNQGRHNFKELLTEYYHDDVAAIEAFKAGAYNLRVEQNPKYWKYEYETDKITKQNLEKEDISNSITGVQAFVFNLRKNIFSDIKVRKAISLLLDVNWINKHLFYDMYTISHSLFNNSDLAAQDKPNAEELKLIEHYKNQLPPEVFEKSWKPIATDGSGNWRMQKLLAYKLLQEAGWQIQENSLADKNGNVLKFEILLDNPEFERFVIPFANNLKELGINVKVTTIDHSRYINRIKNFDFDMIIYNFSLSTSPSFELEFFWHSRNKDRCSGLNMTGVSLPVLDFITDKAKETKKRDELIAITRNIDRIILWNYFIIPQWFQPYWAMIYTKNIKHSNKASKYETGLSTWWWEN
jgi:microcin C transport system substrate-binding protein